jgi:GNAT superfamily N-acetyltransferase
MQPVCRPARADELQAAEELVVRSINDLTERHGFGPMATLRPPDFQLFSLSDDPGGLWVAEAEGQMLGFALSWVSGDLWFLAELFVAPGHQGRGIGGLLLARTLEHAKKRGASNKALITFTFNTVSQGLYIRHGLFPRLPVYFFKADRDVLIARRHGEQLRYLDIEDTEAHRQTLARLDASALGVSRGQHHRFLRGDRATRGVLLYQADVCVGYAYVNAGGHIGPLAVAHSSVGAVAFSAALHLAIESASAQISAFIPGTNDTALSLAVAHGMRITFPMVLVAERDFGDWTRYLPRNPGAM